MKTSLDIPESDLEELMERTGAKTKREALLEAVRCYNRQQKLKELANDLRGALPDFMDQQELKQLRRNRKWTSS